MRYLSIGNRDLDEAAARILDMPRLQATARKGDERSWA
jgi:hypothetical protein